ncbi:AEC family transporter [Effusibacillus dendaii]|uniref:Membrane protein n=1 Tax=Effusibacillus dendaii TaxID=2743772 RepID=A0A7I8D905_9BACL|nr:AEC family transporter [Effusibacillus dendaii]BCJ85479.1 membrane protein [Effusibacillus dendaii]
MILFQVVLPVLFIFLSGYIVQKKFQPDIRSVSVVALYITNPALAFQTFYGTMLNSQLFYIVVNSFLLLFALILFTKWASRLFHYSTTDESALMLTTAFMNSGNYGAPIILFAYGQTAFQYAVVTMVLHLIIMSIFGVYFASRGQNGVMTAVKNVLRMPQIYAAVIGILFQLTHVHIPASFDQAINLVAQATIPLVMLILGMQLATITTKDFEWKTIAVGSVIRLLLSPVAAWAICLLFPLDPLLQKVLIVTAAMPPAATMVLYAIEFDAKPQLVSSITFIGTLISFATITALLYIV